MTHLAASTMVQSLDQAFAASVQAAEHGADLIEFRIDLFTEQPHLLPKLIEQSVLPCIITCRPIWEGGEYDGDEQTRISVLEHIVQGTRQPAYLDIELKAYLSSANLRQKIELIIEHENQIRQVDTGLILSSHDFEKRPIDLLQRIEKMAQAPACRVIKIAWMARTLRDNLEAFEIITQRHKPTICLCMGEHGVASRVLAKKFGALLTFAAIKQGESTASGQPTLDQIKHEYRWDHIQKDTQIFGVIGHPIVHSMSPAIHNAGFDACQFNGVYLPMDIAPSYEAFKATVGSFLEMDSLHFRGASVTIPHKENLIRFVEESGGQVEPLAKRIGAANTLQVRNDGSLYASNTDYAGAMDAVCQSINITRNELADKQIAIIGAGGVARAIVAGFTEYGANVTIYNRTLAKAQTLAKQFCNQDNQPHSQPIVAAKIIDELANAEADIFVNCTPLGMHPKTDASPISDSQIPKCWGPNTVVFDTVYNPQKTQLLKQAQTSGCQTVVGTEMFIRQAAAQFSLWTNLNAPIETFRKVLDQHLNH